MNTNPKVAVEWSGTNLLDTYDTYDDAIFVVLWEYPDAVIGHDGDLTSGGPYTLVWENEYEYHTEYKYGCNAIAAISWAKE